MGAEESTLKNVDMNDLDELEKTLEGALALIEKAKVHNAVKPKDGDEINSSTCASTRTPIGQDYA
jgi:hypothetical protein